MMKLGERRGDGAVNRGVVVRDLLRSHLTLQPAVLTVDEVDRIAHDLRSFVAGKEAANRTRKLASA